MVKVFLRIEKANAVSTLIGLMMGLWLVIAGTAEAKMTEWTIANISVGGVQYEGVERRKDKDITYNTETGIMSSLQGSVVSYTLADSYRSFFEGMIAINTATVNYSGVADDGVTALKDTTTNLTQGTMGFMLGRSIGFSNTYFVGGFDMWIAKRTVDKTTSLADSSKVYSGITENFWRYSLGLGLRQRFGGYGNLWAGSLTALIDYPIDTGVTNSGNTYIPASGVGYKVAATIEYSPKSKDSKDYWAIVIEPYFRQFEWGKSNVVAGSVYPGSTQSFAGLNVGVSMSF